MKRQAPRAFNREMYDGHPENVFYGTDDGYQDGSFGEFTTFEEHYRNVPAKRRDDIHMVSVVGGLYGLNLIPLWRPKRLTIFDINPTALTYFRVVHRVFTTSRDAAQLLSRFTTGDYEIETDEERFVQENICLKQRGKLPRSRGSTKRSYEESWKIALDHFDLTKQILTEVPLEIRRDLVVTRGRTGSSTTVTASSSTREAGLDSRSPSCISGSTTSSPIRSLPIPSETTCSTWSNS